jgi:hypothetical protein
MGMSWADRLTATTSHLMRDMVMQASFGSLGRNRRVSGICCGSDGVAIFKTGFCARERRCKATYRNQEQCD